MVESSIVPACVEGHKILVTGLKIRPMGVPKRLVDTGDIVYQLNVERRGVSLIVEENDPPNQRFRDYSFVNKDDKISGKSLWGFSDDPIGPNDIIVGGRGRTGAHSGQELEISGICFMELISGWSGLPISSHPRYSLLST
jgi:hypothetical protein